MLSNRALRIVASAGLLAASAAAAIMPDWAIVLKAQSYYGMVDLHSSAQPDPAGVRAGSTSDLLVTLTNNGPDDAHGARTLAVLRGQVQPAATNGCSEDPLAFPVCTLSSPLPAGGTADYLMRVSVPPRARGQITIALAAGSWDTETASGPQPLLLELPIEAHVDLRASALCEHAYASGDAPLSCQIILHNAGPSTAFSPHYEIDAQGARFADFACSAPRTDLCPSALPANWSANAMEPNDSVVLWFQLYAAPGVETLTLRATTVGAGEIEDRPADNADVTTIPVPLFRDDFESRAVSVP